MVAAVSRHLAGAVVAWVVVTVEGLVGYLLLLGYALLTGGGIGGPLAGPVMVLAAALTGLVLVPLVVVPAGVVAELTGRRRSGVAGTLAGAGVAGVLTLLAVVGVALVAGGSPFGVAVACVVGVLLVLPPTLAYAGIVRGAGEVPRLLARFRRRTEAAGADASAVGTR
ncbi:hypothetical protein [Micromonospora coxensis]|uniref:Uncharacterized protein n=1 Tax=Micromonospora coxensis TaxID=356852 RepID=A0A1C5HF61_9ACTN|nr:hypothetical protein [Micromonospora coxensis]SCG44646.1 hypothetical protein GA0070614_1236 [Micromonospora coxensis]